MLKKINEGGVESDSFSIQIIGPELLEYKRDNKVIEIDIAYDPTSRIIYIYASKVSELSENEKRQMTNNIKEAVKLLQGHFEVI